MTNEQMLNSHRAKVEEKPEVKKKHILRKTISGLSMFSVSVIQTGGSTGTTERRHVSSQKFGGIDETKITTDREIHDSVCPLVCNGLYRVFLHPG